MQNSYCNNCGKNGHVFHQCKSPITSFGIIAINMSDPIKYLVIRRRDTLGFIDFMRGKYSVYNKDYIMNMIKQMTTSEKERLYTLTFKELWEGLWGDAHVFEQYRSEESSSREKWTSLMAGVNSNLGFYTLKDLVDESRQYEEWTEPEWGFPKGRRDYHESDYECAIREFCEETGYKFSDLKMLYNIAPYEEIFTGSNYKSYKHKYFVALIDQVEIDSTPEHQQSEVSCMEWKTLDECLSCFRSYNLEKIRVIKNVDKMLHSVKIY